MNPTRPDPRSETLNQSPVFADVNLFSSDTGLRRAVEREGAGWASADLEVHGAALGTAESMELALEANRYTPRLEPIDSRGYRIDRVDYHPAYHHFMALTMKAGVHCSPWDHLADGGTRRPGATVARAAAAYMTSQVEPGHMCPITMTHASVATLTMEPAVADQWLPRILGRDYDRRFRPAEEKSAVTIGMGMTEKQGGSDLRANITEARRASDNMYEITGHKWFVSAPMCDAFLLLAQARDGLSCFLMPRFLPDGELNAVRLLRLKDKIGNRSNASSEMEFDGARAWLIGKAGRGVRNIIEMATYCRLDCALASAGMMRMGLARALNHATHRTAFQRKLIDQPLMRRVLADLAVEQAAATALVMRVARAYDATDAGGDGNPLDLAWKRIMTPAAKFWICKQGPHFLFETMECLGGNGYVEENMMGLLYREMPVNAIWEGSGNIMCLDILRAVDREAQSFQALFADLADAAAGRRQIQSAVAALKDSFADIAVLETNARRIVERLAHVAAACVLARAGDDALCDAFCLTHLGQSRPRTYGAFEGSIDEAAVLEFAMPA